MGHTFHGTRFDQDLLRQRLVGFLQIGAVTSTGYGVSAPLTERAWAFGIGIGAFKLPLARACLASPGAPTPTGAAIDLGGLLPAGVGLVLLGRARAGHAHG